MYRQLTAGQEPRELRNVISSDQVPEPGASVSSDPDLSIDAEHVSGLAADFNNRFIIHNLQLKWNNSLRNIILRYFHQVNQRRGFVYYMSRQAVKFTLDIVKDQKKPKSRKSSRGRSKPEQESPSKEKMEDGDEVSIGSRIEQLLGDAGNLAHANDEKDRQGSGTASQDEKEKPGRFGQGYSTQNSYNLRLIAPQIQLQSEKNTKAAVLLTAKGIHLKAVEILDRSRPTGDVSSLVRRIFSAEMDSIQFFVSQQRMFAFASRALYSGSQYGVASNTSWPPWLPLENIFDFDTNPYGFSRIVQKTSASLKYDKHNSLRLKYATDSRNEESGNRPAEIESRLDQISAHFPVLRAECDSVQYYALYLIVLDLLLYNEPLEKSRSERLEKIMLASDFSDLRGAPELITSLQNRIRSLEELKIHFQLNAPLLDRKGWEGRLAIERDIVSCEDEIFFMMKAITTSQRKHEERTQANSLTKWDLSAAEIVWDLKQSQNQPLVGLELKNAQYRRTDNSDGSNHNHMEIERITGRNHLPSAIYPEIIAPYWDNTRSYGEGRETKMFRMYWNMLEAIAGIPVVDHFEVNLFPLRVQLERELGVMLFEYVFPGENDPLRSKGSSINLSKTGQRDQDTSEDEEEAQAYGSPNIQSDNNIAANTAVGTLGDRMKPTMMLPSGHRFEGSRARLNVVKNGLEVEGHRLRHLFARSSTSASSSPRPGSRHAASDTTMASSTRPSSVATSRVSYFNTNEARVTKVSTRAKLQRSKTAFKDGPREWKGNPASDELSQMMSRASSYMTLSYMQISSVVLCLSYKGKDSRNIEDVHNFVFRMPALEYRNKTWSNLDLAQRIKKDVIKALISHTGSIVANKITHRGGAKEAKREQLRRLQTSSRTSPAASETTETADEGRDTSDGRSSVYTPSTTGDRSASPRSSMNSARPNPPGARTQTIRLGKPPRNESFASNLYMTPIHRINTQIRLMPEPGSERADTISMTSSRLADAEDGGNSPASGWEDGNRSRRSEGSAGARDGAETGSGGSQAGDGGSSGGGGNNTLSRHWSDLGESERARKGIAEESEASHRKKSKLLLGRKILNSLAS